MGYSGFVLYNRFIAESITNQGRQIVCTAIVGFENFLADAINFFTTGELYEYIMNIHDEYKERYKDKLNVSQFQVEDIDFKVVKRLIDKCNFDVNDTTVTSLESMVSKMSNTEKHLLYYKNNIEKFNENGVVKENFSYILDNINVLLAGSLDRIEDDDIRKTVEDIWGLYEIFVFYNYPIFDRVRKAMYLEKKNVLYSDTDSVFNGVKALVDSLKANAPHTIIKTRKELDVTTVNLLIIFMSKMVNKTLFTLAKEMNTPDDYAVKLHMENEFYMNRILFTTAKKRYISNAITEKGEFLGGGEGEAEIKGFDFIKSTTKPFVRDYFTDICLNDILKADTINVEEIFKKMIKLRVDIEESMRQGESKYFKQSSVKIIEHYKNPYSTQGITSILLWNTLRPEYQIEFPSDVDIVPIMDLTYARPPKSKDGKVRVVPADNYFKNKNIKWLSENHPEVFERIRDGIYLNTNEKVRHMSLRFIAKPKNDEIPIPPWFSELINTEDVVVSTLKLFAPILDSLGLKNLRTTSAVSYPSNMVDL